MEFIANSVPRSGKPADFSYLLSDFSSNRTEYALGTILIGAILFGFFFLWTMMLAIFICLGPRRVGFLAGSRMMARKKEDDEVAMKVLESSANEGEESDEEQKGNEKKSDRGTRTGVVRFIFVFSCMSVIAASVLSTYLYGFNDLKTATDDAINGIQGFHQNALTGEIIATDMIRESVDFQSLRDTIVEELRADSFCPNPNLDTLTGQPINVRREELIQDLSALKDFQQENLQKLKKSTFDKVSTTSSLILHSLMRDIFSHRLTDLPLKIRTQSQSAETYLNIFGVNTWEMWFYMCSFSAIAFFMMLGTILAWSGRPIHALQCFNTWFLLPFFLVLVTAAWTVLSFSAIGAVMNSGTCIFRGRYKPLTSLRETKYFAMLTLH